MISTRCRNARGAVGRNREAPRHSGREQLLEQWHEDLPADVDQPQSTRRRGLARLAELLACGVRLMAAIVLRCWLRVYHRLAIAGRHNLPAGRSFVLIANHASHLDTLCLLAALPLSQLHRTFPVAAKDYFFVRNPWAFLGAVVVNALPFDRHHAPGPSLRRCAQVLATPGNILILFPEGTRSGGRQPGEFKPGVALLTAGRDIPVVPCHLAGTHAALPKGAWWPRPRRLRLTIGTPRIYAHLPSTRESARTICRELREAVVALGQEHERSW
jgi:1-acyl-sn-glycerol-3-phosphate acyltransferase